MKKRNIYTLLSVTAFGLVLLMGSCKKAYNPGGTKVQSLAGEWWVKFPDDDPDFGGAGYFPFFTYNTSANTDSLWVDDQESFWEIKGKAGANPSALTFSGKDIQNVYYDSQFTITNGKVLTNAAHASGTGDKTDSISFDIVFSDEDGDIVHHCTGYKRTGFAQDDH